MSANSMRHRWGPWGHDAVLYATARTTCQRLTNRLHAGVGILRFDGVQKHYGRFHAVKGVTLRVDEGEVFGLLGPNGAGKTTLIRIGLDILRPDEGEVRLFGEPMSRESLDRVGYLPEERGLYRKSRVWEVLTYLGCLKGLRRTEAKAMSARWLERVGLDGVGKQRLESLSKGMSQKVQIAGSLLADPPLAILDEPFSGLDPVNVELVKRLIMERKDAGLTTVLSTHLMHQIEALCDRVAVIHRGELVVYGEVDAVRRERSRPAIFVRIEGDLDGVARGALSGVAEHVARRGGYELLLHDGVEPASVLGALVQSGTRVRHFEEMLMTMEQVFLHAVSEEHRGSPANAAPSAQGGAPLAPAPFAEQNVASLAQPAEPLASDEPTAPESPQ